MRSHGWNDILVADVDVDASGCQRITDILVNDGNPPENTFTPFEGIPESSLQGTFDTAVFDINNDGALDLVLGRCGGTQVWMQVPQVFAAFAFPNGLPSGLVPPGVPIDIEVEISGIGGALEEGSALLHVALDDHPFSSFALTPLGGDLFQATIPAAGCLSQLRFYFSAEIEGQGQIHTNPANAPDSAYSLIVGTGTQVMLEDDLEGAADDWIVINDPGLLNGGWEHADPVGTWYEGQPAAPEDDASEPGVMAFVTDNGLPGQDAGVHDVDGGPTRLISPPMDVSSLAVAIHYRCWVFSATGTPDTLITEVSNNDGQTWTYVDAVSDTGGAWEAQSFVIADYVEPTDVVRVRFTMCDCPNDSISEAGIDDLAVERVVCSAPCAADLNGDGAINAADLAMLIGAWGPNPGHVADLT